MRYFFLVLISTLHVSAFAGTSAVRVIEVIGSVKYNKKPVKVGDMLKFGGRIEVRGKDAHVDLGFPEGHRMRLKKDANAVLERLGGQDYLTLAVGQVYAYFRHSNPTSIKIKTRASVAGVRGTKFLVEESPGGTYYCVCDGTVEVTSGKTTRSVIAGQDLWKRPKKPLGEPKTSPDMSKMTALEFQAMGFMVH